MAARRAFVGALAAAITVSLLPTSASPAPRPPLPPPLPAALSTETALPAGWRLVIEPQAVRLTWRSDRALPMGDARPEFRLGRVVLGYPSVSADGRSLVLELAAVPAGDLSTLAVWLSGQRLDRAQPASPLRHSDVASPPPLRTLGVDPARRGPYEVRESDYRLSRTLLPDLPEPVEMRGHVTAPVGARGARPLVLFLHGRHYTCYLPGGDFVTADWPCKDDLRAVPSHLGYRYLQRRLASQGYVTVSIAANGINAQDYLTEDGGAAARSLLVRRHLNGWARWAHRPAAPYGSRWIDRVDLDRVLLVGHSRGGEGVDRAAIDRPLDAPWRLSGQVLIGPTAFGRQEAPYLPTVVVLPYCDGDVVDLQGQAYVDIGRDVVRDPALRSSVLVMGANHNYFNSEWTPRISAAPSFDDWYDEGDPVCGTESANRLSAREQRAVALGYVTAAARLLLRGQRGPLPLFDGSPVVPPSAGDADVRVHALGGRRWLVRPGRTDGRVVDRGGVMASLCRGRTGERHAGYCGGWRNWVRTPHWLAAWSAPAAPSAPALELSWTSPGGRGGLVLDEPVDVSRAASLDLRVVVDPAVRAVRTDVRLVDAGGAAVVLTPLHHGRLVGLPGRGVLGKFWAQTLRVPLAGAGGIDLDRVVRIELVGRSADGHVWVLDAAARASGLPPLPAAGLPRVDLGRRSVLEGSSGSKRTARLPVDVTGAVVQRARVAYQVTNVTTGEQEPPSVLVLQPGQTRAWVPIRIDSDDRDDLRVTQYWVAAFPRSRAMTGQYVGLLRVRDDDRSPPATFTPVKARVDEGEPLRFRVELARPVDYFADYYFTVVTTDAGRRQLSTADVPARWLRHHGVRPPQRPVPLSKTDLALFAGIPQGRTRATVSVPTILDGRAEGGEGVALLPARDPTIRDPVAASGVVRDVG